MRKLPRHVDGQGYYQPHTSFFAAMRQFRAAVLKEHVRLPLS